MCVVVCERAHESESVCWQWWMSSTSEQSASAAPQRNHKSLQETCLWRGPPLSDVVLSECFVFGAGERCTIFPYCISRGPYIPICGWCSQALRRFLHSTEDNLTLFKSQHTVLRFKCFARVCSCESIQASSWRATNHALKPPQ